MKIIFDKLTKKEQVLYLLASLTLAILVIFLINLYATASLAESKNNLNKANQLLSDVKNSIEYSSTIGNKMFQEKDVATSVISSTSKKYNVVINSIETNDQNEVLISIDTVDFKSLYEWLKSLEVSSKIYTVKASLSRNQLVKENQESVRVRLVLVSRK
jgi:type II secretory pathway component PulM